LLERLNDQAGHYYVRLYDVTQNKLVEGRIVTSLSPMISCQLSIDARQMANGGTIAYTLYADIVQNIASSTSSI